MNKTYQEVVKKLHFDMHTPQDVEYVGDDLDVCKYVEYVKITGAESVTLFSRCGYGFSYFPTEFGYPHPKMKRNIFGEICEKLREENIDVTAYVACFHISKKQLESRNILDWVAKDKEGKYISQKLQNHNTFATCLTSGYFEEDLLPDAIKCAKEYDVNAFWYDGIYHLLNYKCYCERCKAQFLKDVPSANGDLDSHAGNRWISSKIWYMLNKIAVEVAKINPKITVGADVVGCLNWSIPYPEKTGFVTFDPQTANLSLNISMSLSYTAWRGVTSDMNIQRMRSWQDYNSRSPQMLMTDAAVCASMNSMLIAGDIVNYKDVLPEKECMYLIKDMFDFGESIHNKLKDVPSFSDVAIISSPEDVRGATDWRVRPEKFEGIYQMVLSAGVTAHILFDDDVKANINKYKVVILPELSYIKKEAGIYIEQFVKNGGKLIVIGAVCGCIDIYDQDDMVDYSLFEKLCGVKKFGKTSDLSYISIKNTDAQKFLENTIITPLAVNGYAEQVKTTTATALCDLHNIGTSFQFNAKPLGEKTDFNAITTNKYGEGEVTFIAQPICRFYYDTGNYLAKRLLHGILLSNYDPYAKLIGGGTNSQIVIAKNDNTVCASAIIFHNDLRCSEPRIIDDVSAIANVEIILKETRKVKNIESVLCNDVSYKQFDDKIVISFAPFKIYAGVVIKF